MALEWKDLQNIFREQEEDNTDRQNASIRAERLQIEKQKAAAKQENDRRKLELLERQQAARERRELERIEEQRRAERRQAISVWIWIAAILFAMLFEVVAFCCIISKY